ncbi:MAG: hypothetical protein A2X86_06115 [Bdellovibrionales bacterium GWA2_49_15]|nr:MAG: hypothetical protein A2X86_06115 [Bdellovibrionales bacterium GWA2_49_15]HAZ14637.1 hypothetical protein [Bdellovibrionales bacterium]
MKIPNPRSFKHMASWSTKFSRPVFVTIILIIFWHLTRLPQDIGLISQIDTIPYEIIFFFLFLLGLLTFQNHIDHHGWIVVLSSAAILGHVISSISHIGAILCSPDGIERTMTELRTLGFFELVELHAINSILWAGWAITPFGVGLLKFLKRHENKTS